MPEVIIQPATRGFSLARSTASEEGGGFSFERSSFVFDATLSESFEKGVEWTTHPVEAGADISDHGIEQPLRVTLSGYLTATPLQRDQVREGRLEALKLELEELVVARQLLEVFDSLSVYQSMVIERLAISRSPDDGDAIIVDIGLVQIRRVQAAETEIPADILAPKLKAGGADKAKAGAQTGKEDSAEDPKTPAAKSAKSWAAESADFLGTFQ